MVTKKSSPSFQVGDRVKIRYSDWTAQIVEFRGPLGPGGTFVYRVRVPDKPKPIYIELCEDQLVLIPAKTEDSQTSPAIKESSQRFQIGDRVKIRYWPKLRARIVELRGPLGPGGMLIYRVRIPDKPKPTYVEVGEDQLVLIPAER